MNIKLILGIVLIFYGIFKIWFASKEINEKKEKEPFADLFLIIILLIFGIYSFIHGIAIIFNNTAFGQNVDNINFYGILYIIFGIIMIEFYAIIVYTDIPIPKNTKHYERYKLIGIGGGIMFIIAVLLKILWLKYNNRQLNSHWNLNIYMLLYLIILLSFIFILYFWNTYFAMKEDITSNIAFLSSIALNSL